MSDMIETPAGLIAWECEADPKHVGFVQAPDDEDEYFHNPCLVCEVEFAWKLIREADVKEMARRHRWHGGRSWKLTRWLVSRAYVLGVIAGDGCVFNASCTGCINYIRWRGRRPYVLGWERWKWNCIFRGRHWPGEYIGFDCCGKCLPCPSCDSITNDHTADCDL